MIARKREIRGGGREDQGMMRWGISDLRGWIYHSIRVREALFC
jgi:hypothetical protein